MTTPIQQDGLPYLPEPDIRQYPGLTSDEQLREYLRALVAALRTVFSTIKIDSDELATALGTGLAGTKVYYVSDTNGGAVNRKLTFVNGILTSET